MKTLREHFNAFISEQVESGHFQSTSEVIRAALRLLEEKTKQMEILRALIAVDKQQAIVYISTLYNRFDWRLSQHPRLGKKRTDITDKLLSYQEGSHVIFYRLEAQDHIAILCILHQPIDFKRHV